jgi:hypothetical protein
MLGLENKITKGIFRLLKVEPGSETRDILVVINSLRIKKRRDIAASTHELVSFGPLFGKNGCKVVAFGRDNFNFVDGVDLPHASVLRWSEKSQDLELTSEVAHSLEWFDGDSALMWA